MFSDTTCSMALTPTPHVPWHQHQHHMFHGINTYTTCSMALTPTPHVPWHQHLHHMFHGINTNTTCSMALTPTPHVPWHQHQHHMFHGIKYVYSYLCTHIQCHRVTVHTRQSKPSSSGVTLNCMVNK